MMTKRYRILVMSVLISVFFTHSAFALSTETRGGGTSGGSSQFADPDDRMPAFVVAPDNFSNSSSQAVGQASGEASVSPVMPGDVTPGAQQFNRAFSHFQSSDR